MSMARVLVVVAVVASVDATLLRAGALPRIALQPRHSARMALPPFDMGNLDTLRGTIEAL